ncbi:MAG: protein-L-isoaspartate(D-aspartate) O-methyltransferase, partial [Desulfobacteraceae bacterium]
FFPCRAAVSFMAAALLCVVAARAEGADEGFRAAREAMVGKQIAEPPDHRDPVTDQRVLEAMSEVPRHLFVRPGDKDLAYADRPLPIGYGQTISQPYIVALMSELLEVDPHHKVLEVGTGSGYHAAVLSLLAEKVFSVEIVEPLGKTARGRLRRLGYENVRVEIKDGYYGWPSEAPFDRIVVTCAAGLVPPPLIKQLRPGGRMCIPVGGQYAVQHLTLVEKSEEGAVTMKKVLPVRFVPLIRKSEKP